MSQDRKTHWTLTYVTQGGECFVESTRAAGIPPATEAEMKEGLAAVIAERSQRPLPTIYVRDQGRGYRPTLVFLGRMSHVELTEDIQPGDPDPEVFRHGPHPEDPEVQRHLELVLGTAGPDHGEPVDPELEASRRRAQDAWKGTVPPEPQDLFTNPVPAGPRRFA